MLQARTDVTIHFSSTFHKGRQQNYRYFMRMSQTAMMWQMLPARTKKWKTECMYFRSFRL